MVFVFVNNFSVLVTETEKSFGVFWVESADYELDSCMEEFFESIERRHWYLRCWVRLRSSYFELIMAVTISRRKKTTEKLKGLFQRRFSSGLPIATDRKTRLVVIGNGMVAHKLLEQLVELDGLAHYNVTVIGGESRPAYDRVNLTKLFFDTNESEILLADQQWHEKHDVTQITGELVTLIDRNEKLVFTSEGKEIGYDFLVLATGSSAVRPELPGADGRDVFTYRSIEDIQRIKYRSLTACSAAVIGGGLLGLEAADAMKHLGLETHVVERGSGLLARQLNPEGSHCLQEHVEGLGMTVHNAKSLQCIWDVDGGKQIWFSDGSSLLVDMVIFAVGIRPRDEIARECDLKVSSLGGVEVDHFLRSSDPAIFGIGECVRHEGVHYGLVLPGYTMAETLAANLCGGNERFEGGDLSAVLKLNGAEVAAVGDYHANGATHTLTGEGEYHQIVLSRGRLVGAISVGPWDEQSRIRQAIKERKRIWPWQVKRFQTEGRLWRDSGNSSVHDWPARAEICNCFGITKQSLVEACEGGCSSVSQLAKATGASTACGSCRPLLGSLLGAKAEPVAPMKGKGALIGASVCVGLLFLMMLFVPAWTFGVSVQKTSLWDQMLIDPFLKKVTGFSILGVVVLSLILSLRKRIKRFEFGNYGAWRAAHAVLGTLGLVFLVSHTGFRLGHNLNFILMLNFLALSILGGASGLVTALERSGRSGALMLKKLVTLGHIVLFWPLPALLLFHVLKVYYY